MTANEAIAYAVYGDYFKLFVMIVVGWFVLQSGTSLLGFGIESPTPDGWAILFGLGLTTVGTGLGFVGIVASAYELLVEGRVTAD